jgi:hypothetical protein
MTLQSNHLIGFGAAATTGSLATFSNCINITPVSSVFGFGAYTVVSKYLVAAQTATGTIARITATGPSSGTLPLLAVYIGLAASSGNAYDFDGSQVQVFFGGSGSRTVATSEVVVSDDITFAITGAKPVLIAANFGTGSASPGVSGLGSNYITYFNTGASAATTAKAAGFTVESGRIYSFFKIEVA